MTKRSKCSSCGASMLWGMSESGKKIPLDLEPQKRFILKIDEDGKPVMEDGLPVLVLRTVYRSHFISCPNASRHRKRKHR